MTNLQNEYSMKNSIGKIDSVILELKEQDKIEYLKAIKKVLLAMEEINGNLNLKFKEVLH